MVAFFAIVDVYKRQAMMSSGKLDQLTNAMTVLGLIVTGALTASYVSFPLPIQIVKDVFDAGTGETIENAVLFNAETMLDGIFPKLLPLLLTLAVYYLYAKKKWSPLKLMGVILVLALLITGLGYLTGVYV